MKRLLLALGSVFATGSALAEQGWITLDVEGFLVMFYLPDFSSFADMSQAELNSIDASTTLPLDTFAAVPSLMLSSPAIASAVPEAQTLSFLIAFLLICLVGRFRARKAKFTVA